MERVRVELIDHTADIGVRVQASTPAEAFAAVAEAMFDIMLNRDRVRIDNEYEIEVETDGWEDLLVVWLEELLYRYESDRVALHRVNIREIDEHHLQADVRGEPLDPDRHEPGVQIKAVTYHQLRAEQTGEGFVIQVIFDI